MSSSNENSSLDTVSSHSTESTTEDIEINIKLYKPSILEISTLTNQFPYVKDQSEFIGKLNEPYCLVTDDLILGCCGFLNYDEIAEFLNKKTKKVISSMLKTFESDLVKSKIGFFFCPRFVNVPLHYVLDAYKKLLNSHLDFQHFIILSRVYTLNKNELDESLETFKEFTADDLRNFPYRSEEIFLLKNKNKQNTEIDGSMFTIILVDRVGFENFLKSFELEIEEK